MQVEGVNRVLNRIEELNERFGVPVGRVYRPTKVVGSPGKGAEVPQAESVTGESFDKVLGKAMAAQGVEMGSDTQSMIVSAARRYQVDPRLAAAVAQTESGGNQDAVSPAGAVGVMQLMPETAASLGVDPYDKQQNIEGGVKYLRQMMDTFGGDVQKAIAAYNAGPQAVKDYGGIPPYSETQNYVNRVLDIYR